MGTSGTCFGTFGRSWGTGIPDFSRQRPGDSRKATTVNPWLGIYLPTCYVVRELYYCTSYYKLHVNARTDKLIDAYMYINIIQYVHGLVRIYHLIIPIEISWNVAVAFASLLLPLLLQYSYLIMFVSFISISVRYFVLSSHYRVISTSFLF